MEGHAQVIGTGRPDVSAQPADPGTGAARTLIRHAQDLSSALGDAIAAPALRKKEAQRAYRTLRIEAAAEELADMPLERIKDVTHGRLMLTALEKAGFRTVGSVLTAGPSALDTVPGVGPQTAAQVVAAARQIEAALAGTVTVRIDPDKRTIPQANLLGTLHAYEQAQANVPPHAPDPATLKDELDVAVAQARPAGSRLRMFFSGAGRKQAARDALTRLHAILGSAEAAEATARLHPGVPRRSRPGRRTRPRCGTTSSPVRSPTTACSSTSPASALTRNPRRASSRPRSPNGSVTSLLTCPSSRRPCAATRRSALSSPWRSGG